MSRFDPIPDVKHGVCVTCGIDLATEDEAADHRAETRGPSGLGTSHTTRSTNPTRQQRIQSFVDSAVDYAIEQALDEMQEAWGSANVTWDEIAEALRWHSDFAGEWEKRA